MKIFYYNNFPNLIIIMITISRQNKTVSVHPEELSDSFSYSDLQALAFEQKYDSFYHFVQENSELSPDVWWAKLIRYYDSFVLDTTKLEDSTIDLINEKYLNCLYQPDIPVDSKINLLVSRCLLAHDQVGRLSALSCIHLKKSQNSIDKYFKHLLSETSIDFRNMPTNVVIAGGSVGSFLFKHFNHDDYEDIDLWITGSSEKLRKEALEKCLEWVHSYIESGVFEKIIYTINRSVTTLSFTNNNNRHIQIVYTNYICPAHVIAQFDLPMIQCYFDGHRFYGTHELIHGLQTKTFELDCSIMKATRWPKIHRYNGVTFIFRDWKFSARGIDWDNFKTEECSSYDTMDLKYTVPQDMDIDDREDLCYRLYDRADEVYNKYYRYNKDLSLTRNRMLAKAILKAKHSTDDWLQVEDLVQKDDLHNEGFIYGDSSQKRKPYQPYVSWPEVDYRDKMNISRTSNNIMRAEIWLKELILNSKLNYSYENVREGDSTKVGYLRSDISVPLRLKTNFSLMPGIKNYKGNYQE